MPKKRLGAEQIVTKLRQAKVLQSHGKSIAAACKKAGLTEQRCSRHRKEYGGLNVEQARRLKQLEQKNGRLMIPDGRQATAEPLLKFPGA